MYGSRVTGQLKRGSIVELPFVKGEREISGVIVGFSSVQGRARLIQSSNYITSGSVNFFFSLFFSLSLLCVLPQPLRPHFDLTCSHSSLLSFQLIQFALIFALVRCVCVIRPSLLLLLLLSKVQSVIRLVCSLRAIAMFYFFFFLPCLALALSIYILIVSYVFTFN